MKSSPGPAAAAWLRAGLLPPWSTSGLDSAPSVPGWSCQGRAGREGQHPACGAGPGPPLPDVDLFATLCCGLHGPDRHGALLLPSRVPSAGFPTSFNFLPVCLVLLPAEAAPWEGEEIECLFLASAKRVQPKANTITSGCAQASERLQRNLSRMGNAPKAPPRGAGGESTGRCLRGTSQPGSAPGRAGRGLEGPSP